MSLNKFCAFFENAEIISKIDKIAQARGYSRSDYIRESLRKNLGFIDTDVGQSEQKNAKSVKSESYR